MNTKKTIIRILTILTIIIAVAVGYFYFTLSPSTPNKALLIAGAGGFLILNLLIGIFFIKRNMRN